MTYKIEKTTHLEKHQRYCRLKVHGEVSITVSQMTSPVDFRMEMPLVNWPSLGSQFDPDFVQVFGEAIKQAAEVLREWSQDTGKNYKEVLPQ